MLKCSINSIPCLVLADVVMKENEISWSYVVRITAHINIIVEVSMKLIMCTFLAAMLTFLTGIGVPALF